MAQKGFLLWKTAITFCTCDSLCGTSHCNYSFIASLESLNEH